MSQNQDKNNLGLFAAVFAAFFGILFGINKLASKKQNQPSSDKPDNGMTIADFKSHVKNVVIDIQKAMDKIQPFLNLEDVYKKGKEIENSISDFQVFLKNKIYDTEAIWKVFADLEMKIGSITWGFSTSEPGLVQQIREEISKLNNFANAFKSLLVTRGQVLRQVRDIYNGKNKREETRQHETDQLKTLMKLFQNDIDRATKEAAILQDVITSISNKFGIR